MTLMAPEEAALKVSPLIDTRAFMWTLDSLDEDYELERFFSSLPDFRSSKVVDDPLCGLTKKEKEEISQTSFRFLDFTISSDFLPEAVKNQRAIMCTKALDPAHFPPASAHRLRDTIFTAFLRGPRTTNFGPIANDSVTEQTILAQVIVTGTVARSQQRDDSWFRQVAPNALGMPETVLRDYAANGDSLSLAILVHVIRQQFTYLRDSTWPAFAMSEVLVECSKFSILLFSSSHCGLVSVLRREIKASARTRVAISNSQAGISSAMTGRMGPLLRTALSVSISSVWKRTFLRGGKLNDNVIQESA